MINDGPDSWHIRLLIFQYIKRIRKFKLKAGRKWDHLTTTVIHCTIWNAESWLSIKCKHQLNTKGGVYISFCEATPPVFKLDLSNHGRRNETSPYKCRSICLTLNKNALFTVTQIVLIGSWSQLPVTVAEWCNSHETSREEEGVFFFPFSVTETSVGRVHVDSSGNPVFP